MSVSIYEQLSNRRKRGQEHGVVPPWMTTGGYQMFMEKYCLPGQDPIDRYMSIAAEAGTIASDMFGGGASEWTRKFFDVIWAGWLSPATPVLANLGTDRGLPVSCSSTYVDDSIDGFYKSRHECAMLTKNGFGTASYLGDIRPRGSTISKGGKALGVLPVFRGFVQDMRDVSQGGVRRGAWAGYLEADHGDFHEVCDYAYNNPDDLNLGWIISDSFIESLENGDPESLDRWQKIMKLRAVTGKGYLFFRDKTNRQNPPWYKDHGLGVKASNLCSEITLFSDEEHTFTCVLSSMNLAKYEEWKNTDAVEIATVFLDCVAEAFIRKARHINGLERAVRFTEKGRALGLGVMGFHSYLQSKMIAFESMEAHTENNLIFAQLDEQSRIASEWMAKVAGEPEWCAGYGIRNTHRLAVAPTMSTALICGGVSQGIEPLAGNVFNQNSSSGEIRRINPYLLPLMKERVEDVDRARSEILHDNGSVQGVSWLSDEEKMVFRTAFEIDQRAILRLASARQRYIDQGQSLNLFFSADEDEEYVSEIHKEAALDPRIKALYYMRSQAGIKASKGECVACEG